jgi:CheY-like chemotaxis protein
VQAGELVETLHRHGIEPGPRRLLVVEDDADTRALVERSLSGEQWEVHSAAHGREALAILPEARPELILLDLMMPEMDGFEFLDRLRADGQWAQVPVLVMTAKELSEADRRHLNGSVERVIRKGGQTGQSLLQEVSEAVGRAAAAASPERSQC